MPIKPNQKTQMPMLDPVERRRLFHEVNRGYDAPRARFEALRCLECQEASCENGCPVLVPIRKMSRLISEGQFEDALRALKEVNSLRYSYTILSYRYPMCVMWRLNQYRISTWT